MHKNQICSFSQFNKKNEEVCGFTRRMADNSWQYSDKTVMAIGAYINAFPELFDYLARSNDNASRDVFHVDDVMPGGQGIERLSELTKWLKEQPCSSAPRLEK